MVRHGIRNRNHTSTQPIVSDQPLNEVTLELNEEKVNELLEADVLLIGGVKWFKQSIVTEALVEYAKKKITENKKGGES